MVVMCLLVLQLSRISFLTLNMNSTLVTIGHVLMKTFRRKSFRTLCLRKKSIPLGIDETDCYHEEDIHLIERLLYDNSSPRPPEEFVSENSDAEIESFSPSPIPVEDSDSFMEEIDLPLTPDKPIPSSIEEDDDDSERDILIHEIMEQMIQLTSMCEMACQIIKKKQEEKRIEEEQAAKAQNSKIPVCYDDDDDYNSAITPKELVKSLSMEDEHLNTIPATESDEFIKPCVENLVPNPSESEGENSCDLPASFITFSNILFESDYDSDFSDYQSCSDEDFLEEIFSNPLFEEEIIHMKIDQHHFNAESDLLESMLNHDSSIIPSSLKIDSLFDEFAGELTLIKLISSGIDETDCYPEEDIRLIKRLLYDNSSPRPPKEFVSDNSDANMESFFPSPIPNEDSDSFMEEIDLFLTPDDLMPPSIEDDDNDSERGILNIKMMGDISNQKVPMPKLTITRVSNQEKSPNLLSHQGLEIFKLSAKCPMMIHGKNIPILDVPLFHFYPLDQLNLRQFTSSCRLTTDVEVFYKAEASVIISIPPLAGGVADVVVEIKGTASNEELKEPREDQPLPADVSPTALPPGYVVDSEDEKDPKEDPAYYHADRGNNDDDESSNDDDDND
nr:hypothetical protein [Tanacetum cinerariifolium]